MVTAPITTPITTTFATSLEFLGHMLPPTPLVYVAWIVEGKWRHRPIENDLTEVVRVSRDMSNHHNQTYIALASYREAKVMKPSGYLAAHRAQENVASIRALVLDIDNKDYGSTLAGLKAFQTAWSKTDMPKPSYIVDSGGGLHIYWLLDTPMDVPEHRRRATLLANLFKTRGLTADYGCTVDSARVLRLPGTWNHKYTPAPEVKILVGFTGYTDPEALDAALGTQAAANVLFSPSMRAAMGGLDNSALMGELQARTVFRFQPIIDNCPTVSGIIARNGAGDSYDLWKHALHLAAYAEDGADFIHDLSSGHTAYKPDEVQFKFEESLAAKERPNVGPPTCQTFSEYSSACQACPLFGQIKSPITLGAPLPSTADVAASMEDPTYVKDGRTYRIVRKQDDNGSIVREDQLIVPFELTDFSIVRYGLLDEANIHFTMREHGRSRHVSINLADLADSKSGSLPRVLGVQSVMLNQSEMNTFRGALMSWVNLLRGRADANSSIFIDTSGYGWCQQGSVLIDAFAYAGSIYHEDGSATPMPPHPDMADIYCPQGELEPWKAAAKIICEDPRIVPQIVLAASFAAPLMRYVPDTASFTLSVVSQSSGTGKTTALKVAAAVWAEPVRSMRQLNDTANAMVRHMAMARDMPAYWDDIRGDKRVDGFLDIMFQLTQGREKERLTRSAKTTPSAKLRTILTVASNSSVKERISARDRTSDATARRVLEFFMPRQVNDKMDLERRNTLQAVTSNYGHAARVYAEWLPRNRNMVLQLRDYFLKTLGEAVGAESADRFWLDASTTILCGATVAKAMGLAPFNIVALQNFLIKHIQETKAETVEAVEVETRSLLADILFVNQDYIVQCKDPLAGKPLAPGTGRTRSRVVERAPKRDLATIEIFPRRREVLVSNNAINHYLQHRRDSGHSTVSVWNALGNLYSINICKASVGKGTRFSSGQTHCRLITFATDAEFEEIMEVEE